ncbi:MAG: hypothetical protein JSS27_09585 [Planctomycetes bacterium]|nr:hypothetical protein [Planctomycetota bacterium]
MRLLFSVPVHESNDTAKDLARNVLRFNPGSILVVHVSQLFDNFDFGYFDSLPNVIVNPRRHVTQRGRGLMHCHLSNYRHLKKQGIEFDAFCIISSNEMFVRPGLAQYVSRVKNGFQAVEFNKEAGWHNFARHHEDSSQVKMLLKSLNVPQMFGGQTEGQFFEPRVMDEIEKAYRDSFGEEDINGFETEEIIPPTVCRSLGIQPADPFTLVDYAHSLDYRLNVNAARLLANPRLVGHVRLNLGEKAVHMLVSPQVGKTNEYVYSVKRVARQMDDPVRQFINQLTGRETGNEAFLLLPVWRRMLYRGAVVPLVPILHVRQVVRKCLTFAQRVIRRLKRTWPIGLAFQK